MKTYKGAARWHTWIWSPKLLVFKYLDSELLLGDQGHSEMTPEATPVSHRRSLTQMCLLSSHSAADIKSSSADGHHSNRFSHLHTECCSCYSSHYVLTHLLDHRPYGQTAKGWTLVISCFQLLESFLFFVFNTAFKILSRIHMVLILSLSTMIKSWISVRGVW